VRLIYHHHNHHYSLRYDHYLSLYADITDKTRARYARMVEGMIGAVADEKWGPGRAPPDMCLRKEDVGPFFQENRHLFEHYWKTKKYLRK